MTVRSILFVFTALFSIALQTTDAYAGEAVLLTESCLTPESSPKEFSVRDALEFSPGMDARALKDGLDFMLESNPSLFAERRGGLAGLTCQDLKTGREALELVRISLFSTSMAFMVTGVGPKLAAEAAALGLASPAVMGVAVVGAAGASVIYIMLRQSYEECLRMDQEVLKAQLLEELDRKYRMRHQRAVEVKYQN